MTLNGPSSNPERIFVLEEVRDLIDALRDRQVSTDARDALGDLRDQIVDLIDTAKLAWMQTR